MVILTRRNIREAYQRAGRQPPALQADDDGGGAEVPMEPDKPLDKIIKMIPGEAVMFYTAALALAPSARELPVTAAVLSLILIILVLRASARAQPVPVKPEPIQLIIRCAAFLAWAFTVHNPIAPWVTIEPWIPGLGVLFLPLVGPLLLEESSKS